MCCLCAQWLSCAPQHRRQSHVRHDSVAETGGFHDRSVITRSREWIAIITKSFRPGYRCPRRRDGFCAKGHFFCQCAKLVRKTLRAFATLCVHIKNVCKTQLFPLFTFTTTLSLHRQPGEGALRVKLSFGYAR